MNLEAILSKKVMQKLGLTPQGDMTYPNEGRIAYNIIVPTRERGKVLFRCYPEQSSKAALGYGIKQAKFEIKVLVFLAAKGAPTPKPIAFSTGDYSLEQDGFFIFAYPLQEGKTLERKDLSQQVANDAGTLLSQIIEHSESYEPKGDEPDGDIEYIKTILNNFLKRRPDYKDEEIFQDIHTHLSNQVFLRDIERTPKGLVHGDYFFENIISKDGKLIGVIDFGDAYYGYLLMDIVIGSMEFAMKDDEVWDMDLFEDFVKANKNWLKKNNVSFDLFHNVLLANCGRFVAHLYNLAQDELEENSNAKGFIKPDNNPYIERFYTFQKTEIKQELEHRYQLALS
ncbi:phosphotransferase [Microcoleus sp.]|uniref:phosphotransferase n=1 Tax=Microcoleus sp. TaxID=44472 RepID=UPI003526883A